MSFGGDPRYNPDDHPTRAECERDEAEERGERTFSDPRDMCLWCAKPLDPDEGCVRCATPSDDYNATLWRAQAQLLRYEHAGSRAVVRIPAMEAGHDEHTVPVEVVPEDMPIGGRFYLRCTLDHEDFAVAPLSEQQRGKESE